ncbi:MAG: ATP-binding cassette domain-containing protein [Lachnospiraceae bacterium]|nr:ATP-binding cassette domain-containing protein [Lachnospiraceae bacterium]
MSYIEVSHISKSYGRKKILNDITFTADKGECIGIVGANGCGKSTLLKVLCGAHRPDSGDIIYGGFHPLSRKSAFRKLVGYVPQENPLFDNLTVLDNLKLWYCDSTHSLKNDIDNGIIADFGIDKYLHSTVSTLSGGMKKRLSIACSIAKDPSILILDEPGASLDIVCKEDIKNYMSKYISRGGIIIIASHEEGELSVCSRMFLMNGGVLSDIAPKTPLSSLMGRLK